MSDNMSAAHELVREAGELLRDIDSRHDLFGSQRVPATMGHAATPYGRHGWCENCGGSSQDGSTGALFTSYARVGGWTFTTVLCARCTNALRADAAAVEL